MTKKSFNEKLHDSKDMPTVIEITDPKTISMYRGTKMLIAPPIAYDEIMRRVPYGKLITADYVRNYLARKHNADFTCPLTAGIFMNIAARASVERKIDETPYWRTLKKDGELNEKYPDGIDNQRMLLEMEGHTIIQKGKRYFVKDYEKNLFVLED
ncbi:MGMT family protein [Sedimentibacter saalensis]|uniref:6-O-methylguanine DNA methyltransferase-like protein n=1 Tax=Sedimentibacter saalensis TaxID=130788 RepID=A0A562JKI4_9FIRM|nr:MGMT family protein [Sedimentibacter saalensis]TWH83638.1 6-O-methylguanine DNA methyltransferase-like protein [Sedimentibacter saalensis]